LPSPSPDNRLIAVRSALQDATEFTAAGGDDLVRRFMALRDGGADRTEIAATLGLEPEVVEELIKADEGYTVAHRISTGEEPMYPPPDPSTAVIDNRHGTALIPVLVIVFLIVLAAAFFFATR
jgi:hypothetical protein